MSIYSRLAKKLYKKETLRKLYLLILGLNKFTKKGIFQAV